ncbi:PfkB family carbohydrate kinase [Rhodococcus opacus]|uniref:PfkB family carbohydrate kinase n=1 Tax=Rhodococcus opacus TaxID=37919 RepID=UPI00294A0175|nr:PfkB family carbohydrate kinase [Rhodococcus opacus]MDV6244846.1 PfkB family carbohydrate kinase [Rhodococcus opacus]
MGLLVAGLTHLVREDTLTGECVDDTGKILGKTKGKDPRGNLLSQWAESAGVQIAPGTDSAHKTVVAFARIDADGHANYEFDVNWAVPQLPDLEPFGHLHTGSIAATVEPGGSTVVVAAERMRLLGTVSYDPNIRPALMHSPDTVVDRVEHLVSLSDVVKTSDEDLDWLTPGTCSTSTRHRSPWATPSVPGTLSWPD